LIGWWVANDKTVMEVEEAATRGHFTIRKVIASEKKHWTSAIGQSPFLWGGYFVISHDEVIRLIFEKEYEEQ
jgi:hypothetical protein